MNRQEIERQYDGKIGYCTRSECVDSNEIKSLIQKLLQDQLTEVEREIEEMPQVTTVLPPVIHKDTVLRYLQAMKDSLTR